MQLGPLHTTVHNLVSPCLWLSVNQSLWQTLSSYTYFKSISGVIRSCFPSGDHQTYTRVCIVHPYTLHKLFLFPLFLLLHL